MIRAGDHIPTGHFFDGEQEMFHDGFGNFHVGGLWYFRPDLLVGMPPPPPTPVERAKMEMARLRSPWPSYSDAWQHAKEQRWLSRYFAMFGFPVWAFLLVSTNADSLFLDVPYFIGRVLILVSWPGSFWLVYFLRLRSIDKRKAFAFLAVSYVATSVGLKVANARPAPAPLGVPNGRGGWLIAPGTPDWASRVVPPR